MVLKDRLCLYLLEQFAVVLSDSNGCPVYIYFMFFVIITYGCPCLELFVLLKITEKGTEYEDSNGCHIVTDLLCLCCGVER